MPSKFQCHYKLIVEWDEKGIRQQAIVSDPITIQFNVSKSFAQESLNETRIVVTNMDASTRVAIYQDRLLFDESKRKTLQLMAGYGENLSLICKGVISQCYSERQGVDFITSIDVIDFNVFNSYTSVTFEAGTTFKDAYDYLSSQMPDLQQGECGNLNGVFQSPTVFEGNSFIAINKLTGKHTFIDNGVLNTLNDNETLSNYGAYLIASETGLLGTPRRNEAYLEIDMLFEPTLRIGQLVELKSDTWGGYNGQYRLQGITHNCTISGSDCGTRITTLQLLYLEYLTNSNVNLTNNPQGSISSTVSNGKIQGINYKLSDDDRIIYNSIIRNNGTIPLERINSIANWRDMLKQGNKPQEIVNDLKLQHVTNCRAIANRVREFRDSYFKGRAVTINSGWRSIANNRRNDGATQSQHLAGRAIDFKIAGVSPATVYKAAKNSKMFSYIGLYSSWVHVDIRNG